MIGTALVYSSHDRGNEIHDKLIVQRALRGNRRVLYLPMSEAPASGDDYERQQYGYSRFEWFFRFYDRFGLDYAPFYWSNGLRKSDVDHLWYRLATDEVVILGGGSPPLGMQRYRALGERFDAERGKFGRLLHERKARGLLTVGFSAGADQLCEHLFRTVWGMPGDNKGFGLVRNTLVTLHHEPSRNGDLAAAARAFGHFMVFGLPNDAGLNSDWGVLPSGNIWQVIEMVIDTTWDEPSDAHHIKTRFGAGIEHVGADGRHWTFRDGDVVVRVQSPDGRLDEAWMTSGGRLLHYASREPSSFSSVEQILAYY